MADLNKLDDRTRSPEPDDLTREDLPEQPNTERPPSNHARASTKAEAPREERGRSHRDR